MMLGVIIITIGVLMLVGLINFNNNAPAWCISRCSGRRKRVTLNMIIMSVALILITVGIFISN